MKRLSLAELERRCQKPDHRRIGNWMARRVARPAALRVVRIIAPWGISANWATLAAWACGIAAAATLGWGTVAGWVAAALMLQLWYLLDHVDGQLARLHGTASLDGVQLDYLMHHTIHLLVPLGVGWGLFARTAEPLWQAAGLLWGLSLLLITLQHDARYKAFVKRLKRLHGRLEVVGGGGGRPRPQPPIPRRPLRLAVWIARKGCEMHVVMNLLSLTAVAQLLLGDSRLIVARCFVAVAAPMAATIAAWTLIRSHRAATGENEFADWYRVPEKHDLQHVDGQWIVRRQGARIGEQGSGGRD